MIIELDAKLKYMPYKYQREQRSIFDRVVPNEHKEHVDWKTKAVLKKAAQLPVSSTINEKADMFHTNFVEYLCQCYAQHCSIVLTPDIIWNNILCEIAVEVAANPKTYGFLFTTDPDKKTEILVPTNDISSLPLDLVIMQLRAFVPTNVDVFLPEFSTTDDAARLAHYAAFADVCSPYYNYSTFCCGYPAIDLRGERADYTKMVNQIGELWAVFKGHKKVQDYFNKVSAIAVKLQDCFDNPDPEFLGKILFSKRCGSGGEIECHGWWVENMYIKNYRGQKPENVHTGISKVSYTNLDTKQKFILYSGLFTSTIENGFHVPHWEKLVNEYVPENARRTQPVQEYSR